MKNVLLLLVLGLTAALTSGEARPASAGSAVARYTNATWLTRDCQAYDNLPAPGVEPVGPRIAMTRDDGSRTRVGVRYTTGSHAMVLDYARAGSFPHWVWVPRDCLVDPVARDFDEDALDSGAAQDLSSRPDDAGYSVALPVLQGVSSRARLRTAVLDPARPPSGSTVRLDGNATLRAAPSGFAIGNLHAGQEVRVAGTRCRRPSGAAYRPLQWVLVHSPDARRTGWVQARAVHGCTSP